VPNNIEPCIHRRYFSSVEYMALVCEDDVLAERLMRRPAWRRTRDEAFIQAQQRFNQWFKSYGAAKPPISLLDTTHANEEEAARQVLTWINLRLQRRKGSVTNQP
jgi:hypothetical protein